jgi:hypothetical protein
MVCNYVRRSFQAVQAEKILMQTTSTITNKVWAVNICGTETSISLTVSQSKSIAMVAITQVGGIGSIFDATESGVECYMGIRGDGIEEAFSRGLLGRLGCQRVIVTLALKSSAPEILKALLSELSSRAKELV